MTQATKKVVIMMSKITWSPEQLKAINKTGCNIIVSAGAGSGKTAVLTERIVKKLKEGTKLNELLVLTFTNSAATEMKNRIVKRMLSDEELSKRLDEVNNSYITTFDSFALSIVKKYHYLLNISANLSLIDSSVIQLKKEEFLNNIFNSLYQKHEPDFLNLLDKFTLKNDESIKNSILGIYDKMLLLEDFDDYIANYLSNYFNSSYISKIIDKFESHILKKISQLAQQLNYLEELDTETYDRVNEPYKLLIECKSYDHVANLFLYNEAILKKNWPKNLESNIVFIKDCIGDIVKYLKDNCIYKDKQTIKDIIMSCESDMSIIIHILKELHLSLKAYKKQYEVYDFVDIALLALKLVKDFSFVKEELKNGFEEILLDEYQDTNDLQECFINTIARDNIYMVGDVKQSIYGFRNANPNLFQEKYNNYSNEILGYKIDLTNNFRSNRPVISLINDLFSSIMDDNIGQADYKKSHLMKYGFTKYEEDISSNHIEYLSYEIDKSFKKADVENFIIAQDILKKITNKVSVYDTSSNEFRPCDYKDFAVIIDKSSQFETLRNILEYHNIPVTVCKDEKLSSGILVSVIQNILILINKVYHQNFDAEFEQAFYGLGRSFLFCYEDELLFDCIANKSYKESLIYQKIQYLVSDIDYKSNKDLVLNILSEFDIENKLILIGDINANLTRLQFIINLSENVAMINQNIFDFSDYLVESFKKDLDLVFSNADTGENKVKIMTIHRSKGLEFPICYFPHNNTTFNKDDVKSTFVFDNTYGIVLPYFNNGIGETIYKTLLKDKYNKKIISEKIRLLYVALTRSRQRIIIINEKPKKYLPNNSGLVLDIIREKYNSFQMIYNSVLYKFKPQMIDIETLKISNNYKYSVKKNYHELISNKKITKITHRVLNLENEVLNERTASKNVKHIITKKEYETLKYGQNLHKAFELCDFVNPTYEGYSPFVANLIKAFLNLDLLKNIKEGIVYKEYEFLYHHNSKIIKGVIDLMIEYSDYIDIIDYKLKNISDDDYLKQLKNYADYINNCTSKKVNLYLYSILDGKLQNITQLCYNLKK